MLPMKDKSTTCALDFILNEIWQIDFTTAACEHAYFAYQKEIDFFDRYSVVWSEEKKSLRIIYRNFKTYTKYLGYSMESKDWKHDYDPKIFSLFFKVGPSITKCLLTPGLEKTFKWSKLMSALAKNLKVPGILQFRQKKTCNLKIFNKNF